MRVMHLKSSLLLLLMLVFPGIADEDQDTSFWKIVSSFDDELSDREATYKNLILLEEIENTLDQSIYFNELFFRKYQFLMIHGTEKQLLGHFHDNFGQFSVKNSMYYVLLSEFIFAAKLQNKEDIYLTQLKKLSNDHSVAGRHFYYANNLFYHPTVENYKKLKAQCIDTCRFSKLHLSVMNYYLSTNQIKSLMEYSDNLLKDIFEEDVFFDDYFFMPLLYKYLSFATKSDSDKSTSVDLNSMAFEGLNADSYLYKKLLYIEKIHNKLGYIKE